MSTQLSALRRRPAASALAVGLLLLPGYGAYWVGRHVWNDWHLRTAQTDLHQRNFAAARAHLAICLREWPRDVTTHVLAARAARRAGDLAEAERLLGEADQLDGPTGERELEWALLHAQRGDLKGAESLLLTALQRESDSASLIYEVLAPAYLREFRLYDALACLDQWERLEPNYAPISYQKGDVYGRLRSRRPARDAYRRAVDLDPHLWPARLGLARAELNLEDAPAAWEQLAVLNERLPADMEVERLTVRCLRLLNRLDECRARLNRLLKGHPNDAELLFERGALDLDTGKPQEAEPWLRRANELHPSEREWIYKFALCLERNGKSDEAQNLRGRLRQCERDLSRISEVVRLIAAQPHNAELRCEAGTLLIRNGYPDEGRRWVESALAENPLHVASHQALADYFRQRGDTTRADYHRRLAERFSKTPTP